MDLSPKSPTGQRRRFSDSVLNQPGVLEHLQQQRKMRSLRQKMREALRFVTTRRNSVGGFDDTSTLAHTARTFSEPSTPHAAEIQQPDSASLPHASSARRFQRSGPNAAPEMCALIDWVGRHIEDQLNDQQRSIWD